MDLFRLDGKRAAITGGASGIGRETARMLSEAGATAFALDKSFGTGTESETPGTRRILDVTDEKSVVEVFEELGRVDILVNSAGIARRHGAVDHSVGDWAAVMDVNVTGTFLCARAAARSMLDAGSGGAIVNVASIMGLSGGGVIPTFPTKRARARSST